MIHDKRWREYPVPSSIASSFQQTFTQVVVLRPEKIVHDSVGPNPPTCYRQELLELGHKSVPIRNSEDVIFEEVVVRNLEKKNYCSFLRTSGIFQRNFIVTSYLAESRHVATLEDPILHLLPVNMVPGNVKGIRGPSPLVVTFFSEDLIPVDSLEGRGFREEPDVTEGIAADVELDRFEKVGILAPHVDNGRSYGDAKNCGYFSSSKVSKVLVSCGGDILFEKLAECEVSHFKADVDRLQNGSEAPFFFHRRGDVNDDSDAALILHD